ncbi:nitroreductase family deazaflavin-dependent oxidoreductase [Actinotalea sp. K2]|uniref:nitroreductase family deazaflavin-dependent oxidoreductase n=1 Tax=Actinotalea sp. K2 TaxID=2939438 RepID=UPI00201810EA|nr:nitroreductase family deazaflavin-dependent oxidoreductase [Actinotalea sp. K2]MCL3862495.1 nitroreductase family deazaflavin-dependent oxidoreductase [Actinotalea sp. K2]
MPITRRITRFTKRVVNPLMLKVAGRGALVDLEHVGRRSEEVHHTPLMAFRRGEIVTVALTYGPEVEWLKNVRSAGGARMHMSGELLTLGPPRDLSVTEGLSRVPQPQRALLRWPVRCRDYVELPVVAAERPSRSGPGRLPPPWVIHTAWRVHRTLHRLSGGRFLWTPANKRGWGALRLTATGRRSGRERSVILGYLEDGPDLVTLAMNGWDEGHPAWWLNLEAHPDAFVRLASGRLRPVRARAAAGSERDRLWARWVAVDPQLEGYAARRSTRTPVVVLGPRLGSD